MTTLGELGELEVIRRLPGLATAGGSVKVAAGDDAAVVGVEGSASDWVYTTDAVVEGLHYESEEDYFRVGKKTLGRALSDLAAMGSRPRYAFVNVVAPASFEMEKLEALYRGMAEQGAPHGVLILGGDVAEASPAQFHIFAVGELPEDTALLRSGAKAGQKIFVTGDLGASILGHHLDFVPRVEEGCWLREQGWARSMIDLSDGLATDVRHIMDQSKVGLELWELALPVRDEAQRLGSFEQGAFHVLYDGEDYELLFTVDADKSEEFQSNWTKQFDTRCTCIGLVTSAEAGCRLVTALGESVELDQKAFEHFKGNASS